MDSSGIFAPIIKIRYLSDAVKPLEYNPEKGNWIDLRAAERVEFFYPGEQKLIPLGIAVMLPKGYEAIVAPRSSTYKHWGVLQSNSIGIIDESYCGDDDQWMFPAIATRPTVIEAGDRICQFRIIKHQPDNLELLPMEHLSGNNRGGFGSTGVR